MEFAAGQAAFAAALLDATAPLPPSVTTARGAADPARFAVYRNNVFVGLTRALAQRFPVTERLVGAEFFAAMARAYALDHRPFSPVVIHYGDDFADFVAAYKPATSLPYLGDVARLEAAWTRAYHAADAAPLSISDIAGAPPETLPRLRLSPHPSATLLRTPYPAGSLWAVHQEEPVRPVAVWQPESILIVRPHMTVGVLILPPRDSEFAAALFAGAPLGDAAEAGLAGDAEFDFGAALVGLVSLGAFAAPSTLEGTMS